MVMTSGSFRQLSCKASSLAGAQYIRRSQCVDAHGVPNQRASRAAGHQGLVVYAFAVDYQDAARLEHSDDGN